VASPEASKPIPTRIGAPVHGAYSRVRVTPETASETTTAAGVPDGAGTSAETMGKG
jgi:hypothetical protein